MRDGQLYSMYIAFCMALTAAGAHETVQRMDSQYGRIRSLDELNELSPRERKQRPNVLEALSDVLVAHDGTYEEETGAPSFGPIEVPESCVKMRDELLNAVFETQALMSQVEDAEAAAGWDASP